MFYIFYWKSGFKCYEKIFSCRNELGISEYSLSQSTLETIFNHFAANPWGTAAFAYSDPTSEKISRGYDFSWNVRQFFVKCYVVYWVIQVDVHSGWVNRLCDVQYWLALSNIIFSPLFRVKIPYLHDVVNRLVRDIEIGIFEALMMFVFSISTMLLPSSWTEARRSPVIVKNVVVIRQRLALGIFCILWRH